MILSRAIKINGVICSKCDRCKQFVNVNKLNIYGICVKCNEHRTNYIQENRRIERLSFDTANRLKKKRRRIKLSNGHLARRFGKTIIFPRLKTFKIKAYKRMMLRIENLSLINAIDFTYSDWKECKEFFDNQCAYCGEKKALSKDHFYPLSKSGRFTKGNIIPACQSCNSSKSNKLFASWYPRFKQYSVEHERKIRVYLKCM